MGVRTGLFSLFSLHRNNLFIFLLIVLVHTGFKIIYLNNSGFWYGEAFNLFYAGQDWGLIKHTAEWNRNAPLYYYFICIWKNLFGISEVAIRMSSVLFSSLAAGMLYLLANRHFDRLTAFITLILFTSSGEIYFYSQETSSHSMTLFLSVCSFYLFFNLLDKKSPVQVVLLGLCNFLLVYAQYITVIIPVLQILVILLFFSKQVFRRVGISFLLAVLLSVLRFTPKNIRFVLSPANNMPAPDFNYFKFIYFSLFNGEMLCWIFGAITLLAVIYLAFTRRLTFEVRPEKIKFATLLVCGIGGMFACWLLYILMPEFSKGYFLFLTPLLFLLPAFLVSKLGNEIKYALAGAAIFLSLCSFAKMSLDVKKPMNYRQVVRIVKKLHKPGTLVLVETRDVGSLFAYYFDKNAFLDFKGMEARLNEKGIYLVNSADDVKAIDLGKYKRVLLTQTFDTMNPDNTPMLKFIFSRYKFSVFCGAFPEVNILLYSK
jgi:hypothetical protein